MLATDPHRKPPSRKLRPHCGATPGGCNGRHFMAGRRCQSCTGDHDHDTRSTERTPA